MTPLDGDRPETRAATATRPDAAAPAVTPLALYVHVPWCVRKCPYCDFNSHHLRGELPAAQYVDALLADLDLDLADDWPTPPLTSIFIGGGTPSLLPAAELGRLLEGVAARLHLPAGIEVTLEANPGTLERGAFAGYRAAGINRLSLGVQSFDEARLRDLGRIHDAREAEAAIREAVATFERVNVDLMFALPSQRPADCLADLRRALDLGPRHLSHYELTLEPGTVFARYPPQQLPDDDLAADMRDAAEALLQAAGFARYEVSAWAADPDQQARHNLNYWTYGDYLGIGAGAHGKRSDRRRVLRTSKVRSPRGYLEHAPTPLRIAATGEVAPHERGGEFMLNALRLTEGFSATLLTQRLGDLADEAALRKILAAACRDGLLETTAGGWRPTALGQRFLNDLQARFMA